MVFYSEADLRKQDKFTYYCMRHLHKCPHKLKDNVWVGILNKAFADMEIVDASEEGNEFSEESQARNLIEKFLTHRGVIRDLSKLSIGAVCSDDDFYYFRSIDLVQFLEQETHSRVTEPNKLYATIKKLGAKMVTLEADNAKGIKVWKVTKGALTINAGTTQTKQPIKSSRSKTSAEMVIERLTNGF